MIRERLTGPASRREWPGREEVLEEVLEVVRKREPGGGLGGGRMSWRRSGGGSWEEVREEVSLGGKVKRDGYEVRLGGKVTRYG